MSKEQQAVRHRAASLIEEGDTTAAKALADQELEAAPGDAFWLYVLGHIARRHGDFAAAASLLQRSIDEDAQSPHTFDELGMTQRTIGHLADALRAFQQAILVDASYIPPYLHLAGLFHDMGRTEDARLCLLRAREIEPDNPAIHKRLGRAFHQAGELAAAETSFGEALALDSQDGETRLLNATLMPEFTTSDAEREAWRDRYRDGLEALELNPPVISDPMEVGATGFYLPYHGRNDRALQEQLARVYSAACPSLQFHAAHCDEPPPRPGERPLRIGFVSYFLRWHTIAKLWGDVMTRLDDERFHVTLFSLSPTEDAETKRLEAGVDNFVHLPRSLAVARDAIADAKLDLVYYTDIGMEPLTYFLAFARLARVQCVTWGHPQTTGIPTVDYFISSELCEPHDGEAHYREQLARLPVMGNWVRRPKLPEAASRDTLGLPTAAHLYGCLQSVFKLQPDFDAIFSDILRRDDIARIVLLEGHKPYWTEQFKARLQQTLGPSYERVLFVPRQDETGYLQLAGAMDVLLDPIHFGGGNTTYEAIAAGTPAVTLPSPYLRGRLTLGIYRQMGINDLIADSAEIYAEIAVSLANNLDQREDLQQRIEERCDLIFEDDRAVTSAEDFFERAIAQAQVAR